MAILTTSLGAQSNQMTASGVVVGSFPTPVTIDSETLEITGGSGTSTDPYSVNRGTFGTARAGHANGASITVGLGGGGGGSISVTDGSTTVDPATSLRATSVTDGGGGAAILSSAVISTTDPGAIGAGNIWLRLDPTQTYAPMLYVRNPANTDWEDQDAGYALGLTYYDDAGLIRASLAGSASGFIMTTLSALGADLAELSMSATGAVALRGAALQLLVPLVAQLTLEAGDTTLDHRDGSDTVVSSLTLTADATLVATAHILLLQGSNGVLSLDSNPIGTQAAPVADLAGDADLPTTVAKVNELLAALRASAELAT